MAYPDDIAANEEEEEIEGGEALGGELEALPEEPLGGEMPPEEGGMPSEGDIPAGDLAGMRNEAASRAFRGMP